MENIISTYLERDDEIAANIVELFKPKQVSAEPRPWGRSSSMAVVKKIERRAMNDVSVSSTDVSARYVKMFEWVGVTFEVAESDATVLAEANRVRNILLHRYGEIETSDVAGFPSLAEWEGKVMPMTQARFTRYFNSIKAFLMALSDGIYEKWPPTS